MKILPNSYAIFWRPIGTRFSVQFMADGWKWQPDETARTVVARFRVSFPNDMVASVRDMSGRFVAFK